VDQQFGQVRCRPISGSSGSNGQWAASVSPGSIRPATGCRRRRFHRQRHRRHPLAKSHTGDVDEWQLSNGNGPRASISARIRAAAGTVAGVGDFTGNGIDDILWTNSSNGQVQTDIWELGSNGQWVASVSPGSHPAGYQVAGIGNFTGNGTSDILWQNSTTGDIDEWQIAGGKWAGQRRSRYQHPGNQDGAQMLSIGAELDQLTGPQYLPYWTNIIEAVRDVFSGKLTYSASWNTAGEVSFWNQLDYEGIDNYIPLSNAQNPTLQDLINGWTQPATATSNPAAYEYIGNQSPIQYFENLAEQSGKPLIFTELGYSNAVGAASDPAALGTTPDPSLQAELYQAFFDAWSQAGAQSLVGTYFWEWDPNNSTSNVGPNIVSFSPENSPAQTVVANEFSLVPPTINVNSNITIGENQSITPVSLITSISNPSDDSITQEGFLDQGGGSGHFAVNGVAQPDGTWIYPTNPNSVAYVGGTSPGTDTLEVGIYDATAYSYFYSTAISAIDDRANDQSTVDRHPAEHRDQFGRRQQHHQCGRGGCGRDDRRHESNADGQTVTVKIFSTVRAPSLILHRDGGEPALGQSMSPRLKPRR
jgi:hypothetical protein